MDVISSQLSSHFFCRHFFDLCHFSYLYSITQFKRVYKICRKKRFIARITLWATWVHNRHSENNRINVFLFVHENTSVTHTQKLLCIHFVTNRFRMAIIYHRISFDGPSHSVWFFFFLSSRVQSMLQNLSRNMLKKFTQNENVSITRNSST